MPARIEGGGNEPHRLPGSAHYLQVLPADDGFFEVRLTAVTPVGELEGVGSRRDRILYSPVFPAYLFLAAAQPAALESVTFLFCPGPFWGLGELKPFLSKKETAATYISHGLASILVFGISRERARELATKTESVAFEHWCCAGGRLDPKEVLVEYLTDPIQEELGVEPLKSDDDELNIYLEQIYSAVDTLWPFYSRFSPTELATLRAAIRLTSQYGTYYLKMKDQAREATDLDAALRAVERKNAFQSALVELAAALSYAVTQGSTGQPPVLSSSSPFPHYSLLGVGGAVRALTLFTRHLEDAFAARSVYRVISDGYSCRNHPVTPVISEYTSGAAYSFGPEGGPADSLRDDEMFDGGGDFKEDERDAFPLITHFSLRHGFKESKFSVTAASEALSAEDQPQWTLMTLSHEVMHSRVRDIFRALFDVGWEDPRTVIDDRKFDEFKRWYESDGTAEDVTADATIRNVVLAYCLQLDDLDPLLKRHTGLREIRASDLSRAYSRHRRQAVEIFVHFHDYYFVYARQSSVYALSLWASWSRVAAPFARPQEYLVRTLVTLASGTGADPAAAFSGAVDTLQEALETLEGLGIQSPLFEKLRQILSEDEGETFKLFKAGYYLVDQVRLFFASSTIAKEIDRIRDDEFSEGSEVVREYSAGPYVFPSADHKSISPVRFILASLQRSLTGDESAVDGSWRTAWNFMVVSSRSRE